MNWTELLKAEMDAAYHATLGLMELVEEDDLSFRPATGANWMTMAQLLKHITSACGFCCRGIATGDWGLPEGQSYEDMPEEEMLPPAAKMPAISSVAEARELLSADRETAFSTIDEVGETDLAEILVSVPWNPELRPLGRHFLHMNQHLDSHKSQLFYYLKLLGKPVHTGSLYGM